MIHIDRLDRAQALRYMAYSSGELSVTAQKYLDECESRLLDVIKPRSVYRVFDITSLSPTVLAGSISLPGNDISSHLDGCRKAAMLTVTVGDEADRLIRTMQIEDMAKAVMTDAFASAAVEQAADITEDMIAKENEGCFLTWRFSPGYGDLPLSAQKLFLQCTDARRRIGVACLESDLLTPVKSVTAIVGISDSPIEKKRRGCVVCQLADECLFRKRGTHCGYK